MRYVVAIPQGFRTCLKPNAILLRQNLHRVSATKIACVNGPLEENHLDATRERHVIPLNSEEGIFFLNVILPIACSKLYTKSKWSQQDGAAGFNFVGARVGARTIGCSIQSFFLFRSVIPPATIRFFLNEQGVR